MARTYRKFYYHNSFREQCLNVGKLTIEQFDRAFPNAIALLKDPAFDNVKRIFGTGCGDSNLVAPAMKDAFNYYLPEIDFKSIEALEFSRYFDYRYKGDETLLIAASVTGSINRTNETLQRANKHNYLTVAMTDNPLSRCADVAGYLYHTNTPSGDNNAGLRTYFANCLCLTVLAAALAQKKKNKNQLFELRQALEEYNHDFYSEIEDIDNKMFQKALEWRNKKYFEVVADGTLLASARFIAAKFAEVPGDVCSTLDSENYMHVNSLMYPGEDIGEMVLIDSNESNLARIVDTVEYMANQNNRDVLIFSDKDPNELGIKAKVDYCHISIPENEYNFLKNLYAYIPASILAGYRMRVMGEPMFRGGFDDEIFKIAYRSPEEIFN